MQRRDFLHAAILTSGTGGAGAAAARPSDSIAEQSVAQLQAAMQRGQHTAQSLVQAYLQRIQQLDRAGPRLNAVIERNPDALAIAKALDAERRLQGPRGPLHGIPVLLKDNIATADKMLTSAGSLALTHGAAVRDAHLVAQLRRSGAVILGKANLSEWANMRSTRSSSGWSARGGQTRNPYALDRSPSGSSSGCGAAMAASLAAVAVGTETDGSITSPASVASLVGMKPTVGLVSRSGVIPIAHSQDTAGPMTRTVADAAVLLSAMAGVDPDDAATATAQGKLSDVLGQLQPNALRGKRLGVVRNIFAACGARVAQVVESQLQVLRAQGAELVDVGEVPNTDRYAETELTVLLYELKHGLQQYLAAYAPNAPVRNLADILAFNRREAAREMPYFGQEHFEAAQAMGGLDTPAYREALATNHRYARAEGIDAVLREHRLDALVAPTGGPAWLIDPINGDAPGASFTSPAAVAGYPHITVPCGFVAGLPVGLSFVGTAWSDAALLGMAYAYEQASLQRQPPRYAKTLHPR